MSIIEYKSLRDQQQILAIAQEPSIWERIADNVLVPEDVTFKINRHEKWWAIHLAKEDKKIGLMHLNQLNNSALFYHPYLIKEYRYLCHEMIQAFFHWFLKEIPNKINKILVIIPTCYKQVYNFAIKAGFNKEGYISQSYYKDKHLYDQWLLGLTRQKIENLTHGINI